MRKKRKKNDCATSASEGEDRSCSRGKSTLENGSFGFIELLCLASLSLGSHAKASFLLRSASSYPYIYLWRKEKKKKGREKARREGGQKTKKEKTNRRKN
jgi:hypothetical protein